MTITTTNQATQSSVLPGNVWSVNHDTQTAASASGTKNSGTLAQADFLKLMTAQLQNQDPNQPMDNGQFLGQMAQFSTVSSLSDMANQLKGLSDQFVASRMLSSGSLIGRQVMSSGNTASLSGSQPLDGVVRLDQPIDQATIYIRDSSGQIVQTLQMGAAASGDYPFSWDGSTKEGGVAPQGNYRVDVSVSRQGKSEATTPLLYTPVNSVTMQGSDILLNLASGKNIPLSQVTTLR